MGHYTGHAFHLRFKADTPEAVIEQIRQVACIKEEKEEAVIPMASGTELVETHDAVKEMLADISYLMCGCSEYMKTWYGIRELTQDAEGRWCLQTKGSSKNSEQESAANFLTSLLPYLDVQEGDILWRSIYETGQTENIFYFTEGKIKYAEYMGYWYYDAFDDDEHPYGDTVDFNWNPPLNLARLQRLVALKKAWYVKSGRSNESWDVEKANGSLESFDLEKVKHWGQWAKGEIDPVLRTNLCPETPPEFMVFDSYSTFDGDTPPAIGFEAPVKHGGLQHALHRHPSKTIHFSTPQAILPDIPGRWFMDYPNLLPLTKGFGRYYSESVSDKPDVDALGRVKYAQYLSHVSNARWHEALKHSDGEVTDHGSTYVRPARRKFLDKLARYKARAK